MKKGKAKKSCLWQTWRGPSLCLSSLVTFILLSCGGNNALEPFNQLEASEYEKALLYIHAKEWELADQQLISVLTEKPCHEEALVLRIKVQLEMHQLNLLTVYKELSLGSSNLQTIMQALPQLLPEEHIALLEFAQSQNDPADQCQNHRHRFSKALLDSLMATLIFKESASDEQGKLSTKQAIGNLSVEKAEQLVGFLKASSEGYKSLNREAYGNKTSQLLKEITTRAGSSSLAKILAYIAENEP